MGRVRMRGWWRVAAGTLMVAAVVSAAVGQDATLDTIRAGRFDFGKMWTFEHAPGAYFSETYGFRADSAWFAKVRLAALRIPGCSASFVSPHGLLATNHHCVRGRVATLSRPGESLLDDGFLAQSLDEERPIPGYYADQLIAALDVSDAVFAATDSVTADRREAARRTALDGIDAGLRQRYAFLGSQLYVQIVPLYEGGRYSAYVFRRFTDVRLVAAVELQMGFFGGDPDNFTYPRHALDFAFLRVYDEHGKPFETDTYFRWGSGGVHEGDPIFLIGNPGPTNRLNTLAQLEYQRDVQVPPVVANLAERLSAMRAFYEADPAAGDAINLRNRMFSLSNSLKAQTGRLDGLRTPQIMARKQDAERQLRAAIAARPELSGRYGGVLDSIAALQAAKRAAGPMVAAALRLNDTSSVSGFELRLLPVGALRLDGPGTLAVKGSKPPALERALLTARLADFLRYLGPNHPVTRAALAGRTPEEAATALLAHSVLGDSVRLVRALASGALPEDDPGVTLARVFEVAYHNAMGMLDAVADVEDALAADLGRARYEVYGTDVPPDASSSPRITDGRVLPYEYNGTLAPVYTTFYGMYELNAAHGQSSEWALPERWRTPPAGLDLATPLNFISTTDSYGGNSGSPAVTRDLQLVGLNFDRNIEGLSRAFIYLPEQGRNVMVDVRAIEAALDQVYDLDRIAKELRTGRLFTTEREADRAR
jgi:Peptidase S46